MDVKGNIREGIILGWDDWIGSYVRRKNNVTGENLQIFLGKSVLATSLGISATGATQTGRAPLLKVIHTNIQTLDDNDYLGFTELYKRFIQMAISFVKTSTADVSTK